MTVVRKSLVVAGLAAILFPLVLRAQSTSAIPGAGLKAPPSRDSLNAISIRGQLLAEYDYVAAVASDSVVARRPATGLIQSYVAHMRGNRWDVAFGRASAKGDTFFVAFEVAQRTADPNKFDVATFTPVRADTGYYARASRAIALAQADFGRQTRVYNPAILERPVGTFWVYLMPAQVRQGVYPLSGDVRYLIQRDGRTILGKRQLHNAIIEAAPRAVGADALVAGTHSAVLDDIPEDTDVFHVLVRHPQVPEYVVTDAFVYNIATTGDIRLVGRRNEVLGDKAKAAP